MSKDASSISGGPVKPARWIALLGREDTPTDGVEDYCSFLGRALAPQGIELERVRIPWLEIGWIGALRRLARVSSTWRGRWVLLQYTALTWSRRGFPAGVVLALAVLLGRGARVAIVFHESCRQGRGPRPRWLDHLRGVCQDCVIQILYRGAAKSVFTVPLETVAWLPKGESKAAFISIGANIPERVSRRPAPTIAGGEKTVIVFGVTGAPVMAREVEQIALVMRQASEELGKMRLIAVGRGSAEAKELLVEALDGCSVEVVVRGVLPAEEVASELESADVLLFLRGPITPYRGSAIAGIACGLPIVGYRNGEIGDAFKEAGIEWSPWRDRESLTRGLVRVLSDPHRWMELHERNLVAQRNWFSWAAIAEQFCRVLKTRGSSS
jgi:glycosyltransferase involved in cell wall biosynthesis